MKLLEKGKRVIREAEFAKRLNQVCDNHPHVPPLNHGRLVWVKREMEKRFQQTLSTEAVRKWFSGEVRPRPPMLKLLAELLQTDEAWLSLGQIPELNVHEKKARQRAVTGAVGIVMGVFELNNFNCAFPPASDQRAETVDFYSIVNAQQHAIRVCLATDAGRFEHKFVIPIENDSLTVLGLVQTSPVGFDILTLKPEVIATGESKGGFVEVTMTRDGASYFVGDTPIPVVRDLAKAL